MAVTGTVSLDVTPLAAVWTLKRSNLQGGVAPCLGSEPWKE